MSRCPAVLSFPPLCRPVRCFPCAASLPPPCVRRARASPADRCAASSSAPSIRVWPPPASRSSKGEARRRRSNDFTAAADNHQRTTHVLPHCTWLRRGQPQRRSGHTHTRRPAPACPFTVAGPDGTRHLGPRRILRGGRLPSPRSVDTSNAQDGTRQRGEPRTACTVPSRCSYAGLRTVQHSSDGAPSSLHTELSPIRTSSTRSHASATTDGRATLKPPDSHDGCPWRRSRGVPGLHPAQHTRLGSLAHVLASHRLSCRPTPPRTPTRRADEATIAVGVLVSTAIALSASGLALWSNAPTAVLSPAVLVVDPPSRRPTQPKTVRMGAPSPPHPLDGRSRLCCGVSDCIDPARRRLQSGQAIEARWADPSHQPPRSGHSCSRLRPPLAC